MSVTKNIRRVLRLGHVTGMNIHQSADLFVYYPLCQFLFYLDVYVCVYDGTRGKGQAVLIVAGFTLLGLNKEVFLQNSD